MAGKKIVKEEVVEEAVATEIEIDEAPYVYRVNQGVIVNIRTEPSLDAKIVRQAMAGEEAKVRCIVDNDDEWLALEDGSFSMAKFWTAQDSE